jgi:prevent-host-death family protein
MLCWVLAGFWKYWWWRSNAREAYRQAQKASSGRHPSLEPLERKPLMYYTDDPDQLPALPDQGPRDGRHGVDRDDEFDPYPARHFGADSVGGPLAVGVEDAKRHLSILLDRVEGGEEIILVRHGHPVARIVSAAPVKRLSEAVIGAISVSRETLAGERPHVEVVTAVYDEGNQLPELPDAGPRDGRHGVDRETAVKRRRRSAG